MNQPLKLLIASILKFWILFQPYYSLAQIDDKKKRICIPMDSSQLNKINVYSHINSLLSNNGKLEWFLNYKGGSFLIEFDSVQVRKLEKEGITFSIQAQQRIDSILIRQPKYRLVSLKGLPRIAVYGINEEDPWKDPLIKIADGTGISYHLITDKEILAGNLDEYDYLYSGHFDFTSQYFKYHKAYANYSWFRNMLHNDSLSVEELGYKNVSHLKKEIVKSIKEFLTNGGFLFLMCGASESFELALASQYIDIHDNRFNSSSMNSVLNKRLTYSNCLAFENFKIFPNPNYSELSTIDTTPLRVKIQEQDDFFSLTLFNPYNDLISSALSQNSTTIMKGFYGTTTGYNTIFLKSNAVILGKSSLPNEAKYLKGRKGDGTWVFLGGHDPSDYLSFIGKPDTNIALLPDIGAYQLIMNTIYSSRLILEN